MRKITQILIMGVLTLGWVPLSSATDVVDNASDDNVQTSPAFVAGKNYISVSDDVLADDLVQELKKEAQTQGKVKVLAFFSYGCSWCYKLDGPIEAWVQKAPDYVAFQRVPVEFQPSWRTLSKAYYVAEDLDKLSTVHQPLFNAIHSDKLTSSSEAVLREFFVEQGIEAQDFDKAFDSFSVNRKHKWSNAISHALKVTSVPSLFIVGEEGVYFTSVRLAGSQAAVLEVAEFLVQKEHDAAAIKIESAESDKKDSE